ncbi:MAG TPA: oxygenase MpaB family protein [Chthoniobacteraceae bacterium]|nr:oxygenase MpaB family protein [Chthoniobacteraceae bacterium]
MKNNVDIPEEGLFGPGSMMWRINRERVVLLGGGAATVLQVAHPAIALGVAQHSDFRRDMMGRLSRTLAGVYDIGFGRRPQVEAAAERIAQAHRRVRGSMTELGIKGMRTRYHALDPDLQLWVLATLVMTAIDSHEAYLEPLEMEQKETYLADMRLWCTFFGLPLDYGPQNWCDFQAYYAEMMQGDLLGSHPVCAQMARAVVYPEYPFWLRQAAWPFQYLVTEAIPSPLRERLGLASAPWKQKAWHFSRRWLPKIVGLTPDLARFCGPYRARVA